MLKLVVSSIFCRWFRRISICALMVSANPLSARAQSVGEEIAADTVSGDRVLDAVRAPVAHPWERLTFFPALRDLDREFDFLMLRAAYAGDVEWGAQQVAQERSRGVEALEQEILMAEQDVANASARARLCRDRASRAERMLRKYLVPNDEFQARERRVLSELEQAFNEQALLWDRLWKERVVPEPARVAWDEFADALFAAKWTEAWAKHQELDAFYPAVLGSVDLSEGDELAFRGVRMGKALQALIDLAFDDRYRTEEIERKRYQDALKAVKDKATCERDLHRAESFLAERRKKRIQLQIATSQGSADALELDAEVIADHYGAVLAEVQAVDAYLSNRVWAGLWWKSGVALRLSGDHRAGREHLTQAAAVAEEHRLPSGVVPPSLETWLREGENEILRGTHGIVHVVAPPTATVTVDGREVETQLGEANLSLAPGVHRLVFWVEGSDPIMRLVGVLEGGEHEVVWHTRSPLSVEDAEMMGGELALPVLPPEVKPRVVFVGVSFVAGVTLGRPTMGVDFSFRVIPKWIGFQMGASVLAPTVPYWLEERRDLDAFVRLHGGVSAVWRRGPFQLAGVLGGYGDPLLGAGPHGGLELSWRVKSEMRVTADVRVGYDVMPHFDGIPRYIAGGGVGFWF